MLAYRIEDKRPPHYGPFNDFGSPVFDEARDIVDYACFPAEMGVEMQINDQEAWFCNRHGPEHSRYGCYDLEGIKFWFPTEARRELKKLGFELAVYDLPDSATYEKVEEHQIMFRPREARSRKTLDLVTLH